METNNFIQIEQFCSLHNAELSFIYALKEYDLVDIVVIENNQYLAEEHLSTVEKMLRLHYELDINLEGIDAIATLLKRIETLEQELIATRNKLSVFAAD